MSSASAHRRSDPSARLAPGRPAVMASPDEIGTQTAVPELKHLVSIMCARDCTKLRRTGLLHLTARNRYTAQSLRGSRDAALTGPDAATVRIQPMYRFRVDLVHESGTHCVWTICGARRLVDAVSTRTDFVCTGREHSLRHPSANRV